MLPPPPNPTQPNPQDKTMTNDNSNNISDLANLVANRAAATVAQGIDRATLPAAVADYIDPEDIAREVDLDALSQAVVGDLAVHIDYAEVAANIPDIPNLANLVANRAAEAIVQGMDKATLPAAVAGHIDPVDIAREVDLDDLAYHLADRVDCEDIAAHIDAADVAENVCMQTLAEHIDYAEVAANMAAPDPVAAPAADSAALNAALLDAAVTRLLAQANIWAQSHE